MFRKHLLSDFKRPPNIPSLLQADVKDRCIPVIPIMLFQRIHERQLGFIRRRRESDRVLVHGLFDRAQGVHDHPVSSAQCRRQMKGRRVEEVSPRRRRDHPRRSSCSSATEMMRGHHERLEEDQVPPGQGGARLGGLLGSETTLFGDALGKFLRGRPA